MEFLKLIKRINEKQAWKTLLLIATISFGAVSCGDDDDSDDEVVIAEEAEAGWLIGYRTSTPQGLIWYMEVNEELPAETDQSNAVEIGLNGDIFTFNGGVWTWNGDAATITKWEVDRSTLEFSVTGLLSLASSGISGNAPNVFFSDTQAFVSFLAEGLVVEWNPSTMEIIKVHEVDPLPDLGASFGFYTEQVIYATSDGKIMMPIVFSTPNSTSEFPNPAGAMMAIFDP
ncbi:MAG: hypothetical protein AAGG59_18600, partial [Bacteroidota bacterium]